jgi:hypothetical protein
MTNLEQTLFGPLSRDYCKYFYYMSVFVFIFFLVGCLHFVVNLIKYRKIDKTILLLILSNGLSYFLYRLLYSMCIKSL